VKRPTTSTRLNQAFSLFVVGLIAGACGSLDIPPEVSKETIPLAEAESDRRQVMQSSQQRFNACMDKAGYEFRGFAGDDGDAVVVEDYRYQDALQRCADESGVAALRDEFAESRSSRTTDQILAENNAILNVVECLRTKGMDLDDPVQNEVGALSLRSTLQSAEVDPSEIQEARECLSEIRLLRPPINE
jgi:hypothetical protein